MIITASKIDFPQPSRRSRVGLWFVCFSFLLHVLIIGLLSHRNSERPVVESSEETQVIEATLIFPKLPEIPLEPSTLRPATKAEEQIEEKQVEVSETQAEELIDSLSNTEPVLIPSKSLNENAKPEPLRRAKALSSQGFTQRYMQQRNVEQLNGLIEQEVKQYREQQNAPDLEIPAFDPNAQEKRLTKPTIVACDKTAAKIFAIIGNTMGGKMRCRDKPNIDEFINRRLDKQ